MRNTVWGSQVNAFLSFLFVGSFALGAGLILWHAFYGQNPIANALVPHLSASIDQNY